MIWLTLLLWLLCGSAKADSYAYLQMNLKNNASLNTVKAGTIKMAIEIVDYPKGKDLLRRLVLAEAGNQGLVGQALVANSLFNRVALVTGGKGIGSPEKIGEGRHQLTDSATYDPSDFRPEQYRSPTATFYTAGKNSRRPNRKSIDSFILASGQYEPISKGKKDGKRRIWEVGGGKDNALTPNQIVKADKAIELAKNRGQLEAMLEKEGVDRANICNFLDATGFRREDAFDDPSQNVNNVQFKDHVFNTAGNFSVSDPPEKTILKEMEAESDKEPGFFDRVGQTGDILMGALGLGPDREHTVKAGDTAQGVARELGVDVKDLGGLGEDPNLIRPEDVLTAPAKEKTWDEEFEELKRVWGLYEGGIVDRSDVSERIHNIMKPRN